MFKLSDVIASFNQEYQKKVKLNKTWGLFYLRPKNLAFLNDNAQFIQNSRYHCPPFTTNREEQHKTSAETKSQSVRKDVSAIRSNIQKINANQVVSQRKNWEGLFLSTLNDEQIWVDAEEKLSQKNESIKQYFRQVRQSWNIHKHFQYHSSKGLLYLLDVIVKYQDDFSLADKELQRKKQTWIPFARIPPFIAEAYESFLKKEQEKFVLLRKQVLAALLLRLKTVEQQGLVTCDDVSYTLAQQGECLNLIKFNLPEYRIFLDSNTFNHMQRAIEKHGDESHISQLYQLGWYQSKSVCNADEFTTITMSGNRLLTPNVLLAFMSKKQKKWFWFSSGNKIALQFLEKQQASLAQLFLPPVHDRIMLKPIYEVYPGLLTLSTQYQLLRQSRCSLNQQSLYWWQWERKFWKKAWQEWLGQQLDKKQVSLLNKLNETFEVAKKYNFQLQNVNFREQVQVILETIQVLMKEGVSQCENESLINMFKYISENSNSQREDSMSQTQGTPKASPKTRQRTPKKNPQVPPIISGGSQQELHTAESGFSAQPVNSGQDGHEKKSTGLSLTKFLAGNNRRGSAAKKPEVNEPSSVLTRTSASYK